jgi:hypothetical protein
MRRRTPPRIFGRFVTAARFVAPLHHAEERGAGAPSACDFPRSVAHLEHTMPIRLVTASCLALLFAAAAAAQKTCPRTRAERIAGSEQYGPAASCSGLAFSGHGLKLSTATGCPLFVTLIPEHHDVVPSASATRVEPMGARECRILFFTCQTDYLIVIPWGSVCVFERDLAWGSYPVLATLPCEGQ